MIPRKVFYTVLAAVLFLAYDHSMAEDRPDKLNRLAGEKSPYLLRHAENPVEWYPWGEEAFKQARMKDRPVFLSIGYSTCHWCGVMEDESFSDPEVAALMNDTFISIKVDREERPDIDAVYMAVCQMMTGSGGWPLTVIMTPDKKPFFAGTYFPKHGRFGRPGMMELVPRVKELWDESRSELLESADKVAASLDIVFGMGKEGELGREALDAAYAELSERFDREHGGFGQGMKFPIPHNLLFLLRYWKRTGEPGALKMAADTLTAMRRGGIYDHLGFGFHRYSTDPEWLVPHFEKMLYDQALLAMAYTEAYQATGDPLFASTARDIFTFVLRDMASQEGGIYTALGADTGEGEGAYYLWSAEQIRAALTRKDAEFAMRVFNAGENGNYKALTGGPEAGLNILHLKGSTGEMARGLKMKEGVFKERLESVRAALYEARLRREPPERDDKVLVDWNGLMVASLAKGARVFGEPEYARAASRTVEFVLKNMRDPEGRFLHRWREGHAAYAANADDYAFLTWGLLELYETTFEVRWLEAAKGLAGDFIDRFWDEEKGGFYFTPKGGAGEFSEELLVRIMDATDGAVPSANSVSMLNLLRLGRITSDAALEEKASRMARAFAVKVKTAPSAHTMFLSALDFALGPSHEVVVVGKPGTDDTNAMLKALRENYLPGAVVVLVPPGEKGKGIIKHAGYASGMKMVKGKATAYVCSNYECELPVTSPGEMLRKLDPQGKQAREAKGDSE